MVRLLKNGILKEQEHHNYFLQLIAADSIGIVYVIDAGSNIVQKFTTDGSFVKEWNIN